MNRRPSHLSAMTLAVLAAIAPATPSIATTVHVPGDAATIQQGIHAAATGDTVLVACGVYLEHGIDLRNGVTVMGETAATGCVVVDAQGQDGVFHGYAVQGARLERLTIVGGNHSGLLIRYCDDVAVAGCEFRGNDNGIQGGGVYAENSSIAVQDCVFTENSSNHRGGGLAANSSTVVVTGCTFVMNSSGYGGGLGLLESQGAVAWCAFEHNTASTHGGGLVATRSTAEIEFCRFTGNEAGDGGGLAICDSSPRLASCTMENNIADDFGGGLYIHDWDAGNSRPDLIDCSLRGNHSYAGGGVFVWYENTFEAFNTDILDNTATYGPDGSVQDDVFLTCCDVDLSQWSGNGTVHLDNSDCGVATEGLSWSAVKDLFR